MIFQDICHMLPICVVAMDMDTDNVHVGHRAHQVDPWDHFLSELYSQINDDQRIQILEFYRQHGYYIQEADNEEGFCNVINRGNEMFFACLIC